MRIYKTTDRIKLEIGEGVTITVAPLSLQQKTEIQQLLVDNKFVEATIKSVRCGLKDISGIKDINDNEYRLSFVNDELTDECLNDLFNAEIKNNLTLICLELLNSVAQNLPDGVKIVGKK